MARLRYSHLLSHLIRFASVSICFEQTFIIPDDKKRSQFKFALSAFFRFDLCLGRFLSISFGSVGVSGFNQPIKQFGNHFFAIQSNVH
jgi:hypothetical protein